MLDQRKAKHQLFTYLQRRGRIATTEGTTMIPPSRMFKTIPEEMIELLQESPFPLTIKDIANYLGLNPKSISKAMTKMMRTDIAPKYITKTKKGKTPYYSCEIGGTTVSGLYSVIRNDFSLKRDRENIDSFTVERVPFKGKLLFEQPVLLSFIITPDGMFKEIMTPLPFEIEVKPANEIPSE